MYESGTRIEIAHIYLGYVVGLRQMLCFENDISGMNIHMLTFLEKVFNVNQIIVVLSLLLIIELRSIFQTFQLTFS